MSERAATVVAESGVDAFTYETMGGEVARRTPGVQVRVECGGTGDDIRAAKAALDRHVADVHRQLDTLVRTPGGVIVVDGPDQQDEVNQ